jgi:hypothetical protein
MTTTSIITVNDAASACRFLESLHAEGLLYHPEEDAADCLRHHDLGTMAINHIRANMAACFAYLPDPCETALALHNATA